MKRDRASLTGQSFAARRSIVFPAGNRPSEFVARHVTVTDPHRVSLWGTVTVTPLDETGGYVTVTFPQGRENGRFRAHYQSRQAKVQTGICAHCGGKIFNRRPDTRFCSPKCRTASYRKRHPEAESVIKLKLENAQLRAEIDRLSDIVVRAPFIAEPTDLAAQERKAKLAREEGRVARTIADKYCKP